MATRERGLHFQIRFLKYILGTQHWCTKIKKVTLRSTQNLGYIRLCKCHNFFGPTGESLTKWKCRATERRTVHTIKWQWADRIRRNKLETKAARGTVLEAKVIQRHLRSADVDREGWFRRNWFPFPRSVTSWKIRNIDLLEPTEVE